MAITLNNLIPGSQNFLTNAVSNAGSIQNVANNALISVNNSVTSITDLVTSYTTISRRSQFMQILNDWSTTPALPFLWIVVFNMPSLLTDANMNTWGEKITQDNWGVDDSIKALHDPYKSPSNISGCMFAQEVTIPGETSNIDYVGQYNRGFTLGPVMSHRREPTRITVNLLETNNSFVDGIIRPWLILSTHYGLIARENDSIKADLWVWQLAKTGKYSNDLMVRKKIHFKDCVPDNIDQPTLQYSADTQITTRQTQWAYTRYQIVNNTSNTPTQKSNILDQISQAVNII